MYYGHYSPSAITHRDSSWIELFYAKKKSNRLFQEIGIHAFQSLVNKPFKIEADSVKIFYCRKEMDTDISIFSCLPHAHHICSSMYAFAVSPKGDTTHLIKINNWEFNWQWVYEYDKYIVLKKGTVVHFYATFDNRASNPNNPSNPPKDIGLSMKARDEMMDLFLQAVYYQKGDDNKKIEYPDVKF